MDDPALVGTGMGVGAVLTALFNKWLMYKKEEGIEGQIKALHEKVGALELKLAEKYMPKREVLELHEKMLEKFDAVIDVLGKIRVDLAGKVDKE